MLTLRNYKILTYFSLSENLKSMKAEVGLLLWLRALDAEVDCSHVQNVEILTNCIQSVSYKYVYA